MAKFSVVEFVEENVTEVIPSAWVTPKKTHAQWPDYKGFKIKRALGGLYDFNDGKWDVLPIRLLASSDSYEKARKKAKKAEDTSCLETTDDERLFRRKKIRREVIVGRNQRERSSSSDDMECQLEENAFNIPHFPSSQQNFASSTPSKIKEVEPEAPKEATSSMEKSSHCCCDQKLLMFQEKIFEVLEDVKIQLKALRRDMQNMKRPPTAEINNSDDCCSIPEFSFPIRNEDELSKMEAMAKVPEHKQKMIKFLSRIGGFSYKDVTFNILHKLLTSDIAVTFSFCGKKGKRPFRSLSLCQVVISAVMTCIQDAQQIDIEKRIGIFLATAGDRSGGRKAREATKEKTVQNEL